MKKILLSTFMAAAVLCFSSLTAFASTSSDMEIMYAKLQLAQDEINQAQAAELMEEVSVLQEEQRVISGYLSVARQLQVEAVNTGEATEMPSDMAAYMNENNLVYESAEDGLFLTADNGTVAIHSLEERMNLVGQESQMKLIYIQSLMGVQNTVPTSGPNQTVSSLSRGQSMYGESDAGLLITTLLIGVTFGCLLTIGVQKAVNKGKKS